MNVLALELSSARGSVAWRADEDDFFEKEFANDRKHSGAFFRALQELGDRLSRVDKIVVGLGPGSYAGVRIAIATAIGLRAAHAARLCGLPSVCVLSTKAEEYAAVGDARRQTFFFSQIRCHEIVEGFDLYAADEFSDRLQRLASGIPVFASEAFPQFPRVRLCYPSAMMLLRVAERRPNLLREGPLEPIYLRAPHITRPRPVS